MRKKSAINYRLLMENSADVICLVGLDLMMSYASPSCSDVLGWEPEELCAHWTSLVDSQDDLPILQAVAQQGFAMEPTTVKMSKKDGSFAWMEINARVVKPSAPEMEGVVLTMRDVTARRVREEKLEMLSQVDGLTGLGNRRMFDEGLEREWRRASRDNSDLSLLLIDIDFFKSLNDNEGHPMGDECLRVIAQEIRRTFSRASDLVARYGGEEFAVILPNTSLAGARAQAEHIRSNINLLRFPHPGRPDQHPWITVSIGVGTSETCDKRSGCSPQALLKRVDEALYAAKGNGRNRVWMAARGRAGRTHHGQHERFATASFGLSSGQDRSPRRNDTVN